MALLRDVNTTIDPAVFSAPARSYSGAKTGEPRAYGTFYRTAIKLWPDPIDGLLTIGEGIETTLSAVQLMPELAPAWAVGSADNLGMFPILDDVTELRILADKDSAEKGNIGQKKAKQCSGRYSAFAKRVTRYTPKQYGDFNDILRSKSDAQ